MMQAGMMAGSQLLNNAQYRNRGQQTGFLGGPGAIDGTSQSFYNLLDPFDTTGKASSGHALSNILDPGNVFGFNQAANPNSGSPADAGLPNLGMAYLTPKMPGGTFQPIHNGTGTFNAMAATGAGGRTFNPSGPPMMPGGTKPIQPMTQSPLGQPMGTPAFHYGLPKTRVNA